MCDNVELSIIPRSLQRLRWQPWGEHFLIFAESRQFHGRSLRAWAHPLLRRPTGTGTSNFVEVHWIELSYAGSKYETIWIELFLFIYFFTYILHLNFFTEEPLFSFWRYKGLDCILGILGRENVPLCPASLELSWLFYCSSHCWAPSFQGCGVGFVQGAHSPQVQKAEWIPHFYQYHIQAQQAHFYFWL